MRPTGALHLGHWCGVLWNWQKLQEDKDNECFFFVADWHALTTHYESPPDKGATHEMVLGWLAAGINPERAAIFAQSDVPAHAELYVLLGMICPLPWLMHLPTYKEQKENLNRDLDTHGFLGYPLLQAADILAYGANVVPIGEDQRPNVEFAREIARRFNRFYGNVLVEPQPALTQAPKLPGTDGRKMSKSYGNTIAIFDSPKEVDKKLAQMQTDPARKRRDDPGEPNKCPVADLHNIFTDAKKRDDIFDNCRNASIGCVECKRTLADTINNKLAPVRDNRAKIKLEEVKKVLDDGAKKAREEAEKTLDNVRERMSLR